MRKPRLGLFLIAPVRFQNIGEGTKRGTFAQRKEKEAKQMVDTAKEKFDVFFTGIVYTQQDCKKSIKTFVEAEVDCVLVVYLSWAEDFALNRFLRDMPPVPVMYAYRMRDEVKLEDTHDEDEFTEYLSCGGLVGALEGSGNVARYKRKMMETTSGTWTEILSRMESFAGAARARAILKESKIGLLASYNEIMWSTYVDPYSVFMDVGPELTFLSVAELTDFIGQVSGHQVEAVVNRLKAQYTVLADVEEDKFYASVKATLGMETQAQAHQVDLLVLNDVDKILFEKVGLRPGFYPTREEVKTVIVPEGDIGAGIGAYALKLLTGNHVHFIEPFHVDLPTNTFEGGHAGPNDYTAPEGFTQIARDVRFAKTGYKYAGAPFAWHVFPEGLHTMVHVSQKNGQFILVVCLIDSLPQQAHLATYSHGKFRPVNSTCRQLFEELIKIGVTQHYVLTKGNVVQPMVDLAKMLGFTYYIL